MLDWLSNLTAMKKRANKTSQQISDATGVPKSTLDKLFSGKTKEPYLSSMRLIVHYLGFTLDDLYCLDTNHEFGTLQHEDPQKQRLILNYKKLNPEGKKTLVSYSDDLTQIPKYTEKAGETKKQA